MTEPIEDAEATARALAAFMREEFLAPIANLVGTIDMLAEDAAVAGLASYEDDLARMRAAGAQLSGLVSALLDRAGEGGAATTSAELRHDLRTPITAILGYGELMAEEAREAGDTKLFEPLADVLDTAARLIKELDKLVAFSSPGGAERDETGLRAALPEILRKAVEVANQLARHTPGIDMEVVGRILVVDDNESVLDLVSRRLRREGHTVSVCRNGQSALDMAALGTFDLLLLDLMMPGMDGLEVLKRMRSRPSTRSLPVIVISALDELEVAVRCIEAGADDYLSKPLNETLLRARLASSLERKFLRDREQDALKRLEQEQRLSERLLHNVLPAGVVARLRGGETDIADQFDDVSVLFCDIVGFTALSAKLRPARTLALLNEIFSGFDALAEANGLEKIKTIGDGYMVVGGISEPSRNHAGRIVAMACGMSGVVASVQGAEALSLRIGIDTGPAVGGIIGTRKFFYDVWGDTVNTASRLENSADPGRIHLSDATRRAAGPDFSFEARAPIEIRGKGVMQTFYVSRGAGAAPDGGS